MLHRHSTVLLNAFLDKVNMKREGLFKKKSGDGSYISMDVQRFDYLYDFFGKIAIPQEIQYI